MLVQYNSIFIPCPPNACKGVFNPHVPIFQSNYTRICTLVLFTILVIIVVVVLLLLSLFLFLFFTQPDDPSFADQRLVYSDIGREMLEHAFEGWAHPYTHRNNQLIISTRFNVFSLYCTMPCFILLALFHLAMGKYDIPSSLPHSLTYSLTNTSCLLTNHLAHSLTNSLTH